MYELTKQVERYILPTSYSAFLLLVMRAFPLAAEVKAILSVWIFFIALLLLFVIRRDLEGYFIKVYFFFLALTVNPLFPTKYRPEGYFLVTVIYACTILPITLYYIWSLKREKE